MRQILHRILRDQIFWLLVAFAALLVTTVVVMASCMPQGGTVDSKRIQGSHYILCSRTTTASGCAEVSLDTYIKCRVGDTYPDCDTR